MTVDAELFAKIISNGVKTVSILTPNIKLLLAERKAMHTGTFGDLLDQRLEDALESLVSVSASQSLLVRFKRFCWRKAVTPNEFDNPHVREWISDYYVRSSFKKLAKMQRDNSDEQGLLIEYLVSTYCENTGDDVRSGISLVKKVSALLTTKLLRGHDLDSSLATAVDVNKGVHEVIREECGQLRTALHHESLNREQQTQELAQRLVDTRNSPETSSEKLDAIERYYKVGESKPQTAIDLLLEFKKADWGMFSEHERYVLFVRIANLYQELGLVESALEYFEQALSYVQKGEKKLKLKAVISFINEDYPLVVEYAQECLEIDPEDEDCYPLLVLGASYQDEGFDYTSLVPKRFQANARCAFAASQGYLRQNKREEALMWAQVAYEQDHDDILIAGSYAALMLEPISNAPEIRVGDQFSNEALAVIDSSKLILEQLWSTASGTESVVRCVPVGSNLVNIYRLLGEKNEEAKAIVKELQSIEPDNIHLKKLAVHYAIVSREYDAALKIASEVQGVDCELDLNRLELLFNKGEFETAVKIVSQIERSKLSCSAQKVLALYEVRLSLELEGESAAKSVIEKLAPSITSSGFFVATWSRVLEERGKVDEATSLVLNSIEQLRETATYDDKLELAHRLYQMKEYRRAANLFREVVTARNDSEALQAYISSLAYGELRAELKQILSSLSNELQEQAFYLGTKVWQHYIVGELSEAANAAELFFRLHGDDLQIRLYWMDALIRDEQFQKVKKWAKKHPRYDGEDSNLRISFVYWLKKIGLEEEAIQFAYNTYRAFPNSLEVIEAYLELFLQDLPQLDLFNSENVSPGTCVVFESEDGESHNLIISPSGEEPLWYETTEHSPFIKKCLGLRVGDEFVFKKAFEIELRYVVKSILSCYLETFHRAGDYVGNVSNGSQRFLLLKDMVDDEGEFDIERLFKVLDQPAEKKESATQLYKEKAIPVGLLAAGLNCSVLDAWKKILHNEEFPVFAANPFKDDFKQSVDELANGCRLLLDPLSLYLCFHIGIESAVREFADEVGITQSAKDLFKSKLRELEQQRTREEGLITSDEDSSLEKEITVIQRLVKFIEENCTVLPAVPSVDFEKDAFRFSEGVGVVHSDLLYAASGSGWRCLSEDSTFRVLAEHTHNVKLIWLQPVLFAAWQRKIISSAQYLEALCKLSSYGYTCIHVTPHLLGCLGCLDNTDNRKAFSVMMQQNVMHKESHDALMFCLRVVGKMWAYKSRNTGYCIVVILDSLYQRNVIPYYTINLLVDWGHTFLSDYDLYYLHDVLADWCCEHSISLESIGEIRYAGMS